MNSVELVREICHQRRIPISRLERECGFSNGYIRKLKKGSFPADKLDIIARYLDVPYQDLAAGVQTSGQQTGYYANEEAAQLADELLENPELRALLSAARGVRPDLLEQLSDFLYKLKETNPNG